MQTHPPGDNRDTLSLKSVVRMGNNFPQVWAPVAAQLIPFPQMPQN